MKRLVQVAVALVTIVIILGAYTRLTDAGLGCPDWPGCYGFATVPTDEARIQAAQEAFPTANIDHAKAWNEMIHRYAAGILGLVIFAIVTVAIRRRMKGEKDKPFKHPLFLGGLIIFQAALGMWTVTMMLQPAIVMGHLLGGFTTFSLLTLLYLRESNFQPSPVDTPLRKILPFCVVTLILIACQIALGGWVAANYAALACTELPICQGNWAENLEVVGAFTLEEADTYEFGIHPYEERMTMHVFHRIGAIFVTVAVLTLLSLLWRKAQTRWFTSMAAIITFLLVAQITLGVLNVTLSLPLFVAVAHNFVGALLLVSVLVLTYGIYKLDRKEVIHG